MSHSTELTLLIAEPRDIIRVGLRTLFAGDNRITQIYEVKTQEALHQCMNTCSFSLLVMNQLLITDISLLPRGRFAILATELDISIFQKAYEHGARAYLLESTSADLFRAILSCEEKGFLIEPTLAIPILEYLSSDARFAVNSDLLTSREREIVELLREGIDRRSIAHQLCISEATLKTHIKNITRKRKEGLPRLKLNVGS